MMKKRNKSGTVLVAGDPAAGKLVYELHCQRCHGTGGWGDGLAGRSRR